MTAKPLLRTKISEADLTCWQATLASFGINIPGKGGQLLDVTLGYLSEGGYTVTEISPMKFCLVEADRPWVTRRYTLNRFITEHPEGDWVVCTDQHVMSLRDGQLTDTETDAGGRRRVWSAYRITQKEVTA